MGSWLLRWQIVNITHLIVCYYKYKQMNVPNLDFAKDFLFFKKCTFKIVKFIYFSMEHPGVAWLRPGEDNIAILDSVDVAKAPREFVDLLTKLGQASSTTQGLPHVITTYSSVINSESRLYILVSDDHKKAIGFCKVGIRHLFIWDHAGGQHEINPLCLLDFFVCNECQRSGYGKKIYDAMLKNEQIEPRMVAIDRPSRLCLSFMKKHFNLTNYVPQSNNYVVFDDYWDGTEVETPTPTISKTPTRPRQAPLVSAPQPSFASTPKKQRYNPITWEPLD